MTTLHLISQPAALQACRARIGMGDSILLIEAGVCLVLSMPLAGSGLETDCYVLKEHLEMASVQPELPDCRWVPVDFAGFVELTEHHETIINW